MLIAITRDVVVEISSIADADAAEVYTRVWVQVFWKLLGGCIAALAD